MFKLFPGKDSESNSDEKEISICDCADSVLSRIERMYERRE